MVRLFSKVYILNSSPTSSFSKLLIWSLWSLWHSLLQRVNSMARNPDGSLASKCFKGTDTRGNGILVILHFLHLTILLYVLLHPHPVESWNQICRPLCTLVSLTVRQHFEWDLFDQEVLTAVILPDADLKRSELVRHIFYNIHHCR